MSFALIEELQSEIQILKTLWAQVDAQDNDAIEVELLGETLAFPRYVIRDQIAMKIEHREKRMSQLAAAVPQGKRAL